MGDAAAAAAAEDQAQNDYNGANYERGGAQQPDENDEWIQPSYTDVYDIEADEAFNADTK